MEFEKIEQMLNEKREVEAARVSINKALISSELDRVCVLMYKACEICAAINSYRMLNEDRFVIIARVNGYARVSLEVEFLKNSKCNPIVGHISYDDTGSPLSSLPAPYLHYDMVIERSRFYQNDSSDILISAYKAITPAVIDELLFKKMNEKTTNSDRITKLEISCSK